MGKVLNILFVEDDTIETIKFKRVLKTLELNHNIIEAINGEQALELLSTSSLIPDLIIMDLNMPKLSGIEFLNILKKNLVFKYIPCVILTTSGNYKDIKECYEIGIAGYIIKPLKYDDYVERIERLLKYWSTNELISQI